MTCSHGPQVGPEPRLLQGGQTAWLVWPWVEPRDAQRAAYGMTETEYLLSSESTLTGVVRPGTRRSINLPLWWSGANIPEEKHVFHTEQHQQGEKVLS